MFSNAQVEDFINKCGLKYKIHYASDTQNRGSTWFCVYDKKNQPALDFNPFSCWLVDLRTNQKYHTDTVTKFKKFCQILSMED